MTEGRPAVFLDRDGTVIEDGDYLADPKGVHLLPGVADAIARLNAAAIPVVIATNQSGIGRGYFSENDYEAVHLRMIELLAMAGAKVTATYHCPHSPELVPSCACRKPSPGMFEQAAGEHALDLGRSFYVGDRVRDLAAGVEKGGRGFLVGTGKGEVAQGIDQVPGLADAVTLIMAALEPI